MITLDKYADNKEMYGRLFITKSEQFGIGLYLSIRCNAKSWINKNKFVKLPNSSVLDWDSMKNDEILHTYENVSFMSSALEQIKKLEVNK